MDEYEALGAFFHQREKAKRIAERHDLQWRKVRAFDWFFGISSIEECYSREDLLYGAFHSGDPLRAIELEMERES